MQAILEVIKRMVIQTAVELREGRLYFQISIEKSDFQLVYSALLVIKGTKGLLFNAGIWCSGRQSAVMLSSGGANE